jgi:hypothetical protein
LVLGYAFRQLAWALVGVGVLGAIGLLSDNDIDASARIFGAVACLVGFAVTAAFTAFFGHVLKLLVAIYSQVWELQFVEDGEH